MLKKHHLILFLLLPIIAFSKPILPIQYWVLPNKTRVFFVRRTELPMLDVSMVFDAGSSRDGKNPGIAALTNAMLDEGTKELTHDKIANTFDMHGAQIDSFSRRDYAGIHVRTLVDKDYLNPVLTLFSKIITAPVFPDLALQRITKQFIAALQAEAQNPLEVATDHFYRQLYGNHPYAHNPLGSEKSLASISQADLNAFYKRYYTGANANLILVGDITEKQAKAFVAMIAGGFSTGKKASAIPPATQLIKSQVVTVHFPSVQSTFLFGQVGISRKNKDYNALMVGNAIFGGMPMSSILVENIREKNGLAYMAFSQFNPLLYRGPFVIVLQTKNDMLKKASVLTKDLLGEFVENGPDDRQISAAKQYLLGSFPLEFSSNASILSVLINLAFYHRPLDYLDTYPAQIAAVSRQQIKSAFQKNIALKKMLTVVVGNRA